MELYWISCPFINLFIYNLIVIWIYFTQGECCQLPQNGKVIHAKYCLFRPSQKMWVVMEFWEWEKKLEWKVFVCFRQNFNKLTQILCTLERLLFKFTIVRDVLNENIVRDQLLIVLLGIWVRRISLLSFVFWFDQYCAIMEESMIEPDWF